MRHRKKLRQFRKHYWHLLRFCSLQCWVYDCVCQVLCSCRTFSLRRVMMLLVDVKCPSEQWGHRAECLSDFPGEFKIKECGSDVTIILLYVCTWGHIEMTKNLKMREMGFLPYIFVSSTQGRSKATCKRGRSVPRPAGFHGQIPLGG